MTIKELRDGLIQDLAENAYLFGLEGTKMLYEALNKQIPKRPHLERDGYDDNGCMIHNIWICSCCAHEVDYNKHEYCPCCGQRLDWSEDE